MKSLKIAWVVLLAVGLMQNVAAAEEELGTDSTSTALISLSVDEMVQIVGVGDATVNWDPTYGTASSMTAGDNSICVFSNVFTATTGGGGKYDLLVDGSSTKEGTELAVTSAGGYAIQYSFEWYTSTTTTGAGIALTAGASTAGLANGDTDLAACDNNSGYKVTFSGAEVLKDNPAGSYSGNLVLVVTPN